MSVLTLSYISLPKYTLLNTDALQRERADKWWKSLIRYILVYEEGGGGGGEGIGEGEGEGGRGGEGKEEEEEEEEEVEEEEEEEEERPVTPPRIWILII